MTLICWWHLLSLDAPTVAAVWAYLFAHVVHIRLPWIAPLILALGTWLIYIADRLLDGISHEESKRLRERHYFYARNFKLFLTAVLAGGAILLWLIATRMYVFARIEDAVVFGAAMAYFGVIHGTSLGGRKRVEEVGQNEASLAKNDARSKRVRLPKELAVALLFASATAVPAWSRLDGTDAGQFRNLSMAVICFAVICWLNCVAIEHWETTDRFEPSFFHMHATTEWAGRNLASIAVAISGIAFCLSVVTIGPVALEPVFLSAALSAAMLFALNSLRGSLSSLQLRVAADAALLTPLLFLMNTH